jgi:DNA-binding NarL/FixJ family response regulator
MDLKEISVLIVDDHPIFRFGLIYALRKLNIGSTFLEADEASNALMLADENKIDLFIVDYKMPEMNGFELIKKLLQQDDKRKIILLSSFAEPELICAFYTAGVCGYLEKNCTHSEILKAVTEIFSGRVYYHNHFREVFPSPIDNLLSKKKSNNVLSFTTNELELARSLADGLSSKEIAILKGLTPKTIETYRSRLLQKTGTSNTAKLLDYLYRHGVL